MKFKRIFLLVLDSVGIGASKDSDLYGDATSNTLLHTLEESKVELPNFEELGLLNLLYDDEKETKAYYTKGLEISNGKDTLTGHLEMMGIKTEVPFKTFTETGFPKELIEAIEYETGRRVIGNVSASGTEIINELGEEHIRKGSLIVYTSADSVLQVAAHESIIPVKELYRICEIIRKLTLKEEWKVGRVIARPFIGKPGNFTRTSNRHDYALDPSGKTILDHLKENNISVISIGKIADIFNNNGITKSTKTKDNLDGIKTIISTIKENFTGLCFANLNDFDSKYGHRRDPLGYGKALKEVDDYLPNIINSLNNDDLLIITADHGNDPTYPGTDHTRENVPVLIYSPIFKETKELPYLQTFADIGATIADNFNVPKTEIGESFLDKLK